MAYPGLWLCGPPGVGKSTVGYEIFVAVHRSGPKGAYIDADQVGMCYPTPGEDPRNHHLKSANVGAVWRNFQSAGALFLVASGVIENQEELRLYREQLVDVSLIVCRLSIDDIGLHTRLATRSAGYGPPVPGQGAWRTVAPGFVRAAMITSALLAETSFADIVVETRHLSPLEVAARVRDQAGGWPPL